MNTDHADQSALDTDDRVRDLFGTLPSWEMEQIERAAFEEERAYAEWLADRLEDGHAAEESTPDHWTEESIARWEAAHDL